MKLVIAVINNDDSRTAITALTGRDFFVTQLSTTGGFPASSGRGKHGAHPWHNYR